MSKYPFSHRLLTPRPDPAWDPSLCFDIDERPGFWDRERERREMMRRWTADNLDELKRFARIASDVFVAASGIEFVPSGLNAAGGFTRTAQDGIDTGFRPSARFCYGDVDDMRVPSASIAQEAGEWAAREARAVFPEESVLVYWRSYPAPLWIGAWFSDDRPAGRVYTLSEKPYACADFVAFLNVPDHAAEYVSLTGSVTFGGPS